MTEKKISLLEFENNPNIGIYLFLNDKFCLIGKEISEEKKKEIENIIDVPIYKISILGTELIGIFLAGNNEKIFIPELLNEEYNKLKEITTEHNVEIITLNDKMNTYGNNLCVGDKEILVSKDYNNNFLKKLEKVSKLKIISIGNENFKATGALCQAIEGKYFVSQELDEKDFKPIIKKILGVGTINSGSNYISSGVIGNKNGLLIGSLSSTIEIQNLFDAFN